MVCTNLSRALQLLIFTIVLRISICSPTTPKPNIIQREADELRINQRKQGGFFSILGVGAYGGNKVYPRLEIREFQKRSIEWNLFLLSLNRLQSVPQSDKLSYYQIAGIHGRAFVPWDGVGPGDGLTGGYCVHSSNIFLPWHRPYLCLLESAIYLNAREIVRRFPDGEFKTKCEAALPSIRLPYLDWAATLSPGDDPLPASLRSTTIEVVLPNGTATIPNPLCSYRYDPLNATDMGGAPWTVWPRTFRDPSSREADAESQYDAMSLELGKNQPSLRRSVFKIFLQHDYSKISNDRTSSDTIEAVHDMIHNMFGRGGHMSYLAYAAFDPIFWLHHCAVDRLFAIWQALNDNNGTDSYVTADKIHVGTFVVPSGFIADADTALPPFHINDQGKFHTSRTCRSITPFGYTYPEIEAAGGNTTVLTETVRSLYEDLPDDSQVPSHVARAPNFSQQKLYSASVKAYKFCNKGSINIYFFLGAEPGPNSRLYANETSFIGMTGILSQPQDADVPKSNVLVNRAVELTAALKSKVMAGEIPSLDEDIVVPYLRKNLCWKITKPDGEKIPIDSLPDFKVSVLCQAVEPAKDKCELPKIVGEPKVLVDATDGLPGGFSQGDALNKLS